MSFQIDEINNIHVTLTNLANTLEQSNLTELIDATEEIELNPFIFFPRFHLEELHTFLIRILLDPTGPHRQGPYFLNQFIKIIKPISDKLKANDVMNWSSAKIENRDKNANVFGRMDIFLQVDNYALVIENKIFSEEGKNQLKRYAEYCESKGLNFDILFLAPYAKSSIYHDKFSNYYSISYKNEIRNWILISLKEKILPSSLTSLLKSYVELLEKRILLMREDEITNKIAELLIDDEKNHLIIKYLDDIRSSMVSIRNKLRKKFFSDLLEELSKNDKFKFLPHNLLNRGINVDQIWDSPNRGLILQDVEFPSPWNPTTTLQFTIEHDWDKLYYGMTLKHNNSIIPADLQNQNAVIDINKKLSNNLNKEIIINDEKWFFLIYSNLFENKSFASDQNNYQLALDKNEKKLPKKLANDVFEYLKFWQSDYGIISC